MPGPIILHGRKAIRSALGDISERTFYRYVKHLGLPVKIIGGRVTISVKQLEKWWERLEEIS